MSIAHTMIKRATLGRKISISALARIIGKDSSSATWNHFRGRTRWSADDWILTLAALGHVSVTADRITIDARLSAKDWAKIQRVAEAGMTAI